MRLPTIDLPRPVAILLCLGGLIPQAFIPNGALALFVAALVALLLSKDARGAILRWAPAGPAREIALGLAAGMGFALLSMLVLDPIVAALLNEKTDLSSFANVRGNIANALILLAIAWVIGALLEEVTSRGMVIGWGSRLLGERATVPLYLITSAAFGAAHLYQGKVGAISSFFSGLAFGAIYLGRRKTLLAPVMAHGIFDTIGVAAIYFGANLA